MFKSLITVIGCYLLIACGDSDQVVKPSFPLDFEDSDSCHLCAMMITAYPGPKGQGYDNETNQVQKFCSTSDMILWYLKSVDRSNITDMYVHDMSITSWNQPDDEHLILAEEAYYVIGSEKDGSMGPTLATFSKQHSATDFIAEYGGKMLLFDKLIEELSTKK